jgi:hypothetical protein
MSPHDSSDNGRITLRDHFAEQIRWVDKYFQQQLDNSKEEVEKAYRQLESRLAGMNEFRDTLKDQAIRLATKDDIMALDKRINLLERFQSTGEGRAGGTAVFWAIGASILSSVVTAVLVYIILKGLK